MSHITEKIEWLTQSLSQLAQQVNAEHLFVATASRAGARPATDAVESELGAVTAMTELLAFHLYPHFSATKELKAAITPQHTMAAWTLVEELFTLIQLNERLPEDAEPREARTEQEQAEGFWTGQAVEHVKLYGMSVRSSAYPEQTSRHIEELQGQFDSKLAFKVGISPKRATQLVWALSKRMEDEFEKIETDAIKVGEATREEWREARTAKMRSQSSPRLNFLRRFKDKDTAFAWGRLEKSVGDAWKTPIGFDDICDQLEPPLTVNEWDAFVNSLGMTEERRKTLIAPEEVRLFPVYILSDGRVLLRDLGHTFDRVWELFDAAAKSDNKLFDKYQKFRAVWLENRAVEYLKRLFPDGAVMEKALYPNPDIPGDETELDVLVSWGPFVLLVECKAKQFRLDAQLQRRADGQVGNAGKLRSDVQANVEEAFDQTQRALRYIEASAAPTFKEQSSGRVVQVAKGEGAHIYPITLSLLAMADIANYRPALRELGLFKDGVFPLALCADELDLITQFCDGPEVFLHYVERRQVLRSLPFDVFGDELGVFAAYLETRLREEDFTRDGQPSLVMFSGMTDEFDRWMNFQRGVIDEKPDIRLKIPKEIVWFLRELRSRGEKFSCGMTFALLDLSDGLLEQIAATIQKLHASPPVLDYRTFQLSDPQTQTTIVLVSTIHESLGELSDHLQMRATVEKYQSRSERCIGFGIYLPNRLQPFACTFWNEEEWKYDEEIEAKMASLPKRHIHAVTNKDGKMSTQPERNAPCFCGSGKKFKKCCINRV